VSGRLHAPECVPPVKNSRYPLDRILGGPQRQSERCREEKILDPTGTRSRSRSLYRLSYPSSALNYIILNSILKERGGIYGLDLSGSGYVPVFQWQLFTNVITNLLILLFLVFRLARIMRLKNIVLSSSELETKIDFAGELPRTTHTGRFLQWGHLLCYYCTESENISAGVSVMHLESVCFRIKLSAVVCI
jgi:hypothetical protein